VPAQAPPVAPVRPREHSLLSRQFEHRSGRIIALCRFVLATVFFVALWIDPSQPARSDIAGYGMLFGFMLISTGLFILAWSDWWWDQRLAWPMHFFDITAFLGAVYFTETNNGRFTSPFLAFFSYLMLSATIRWNWRVTALTGLLTTMLYLLVGIGMNHFGAQIDLYRFGRRVSYMLVLALVLIWFGLQRREQSIARFVEPPGSADDRLPPLMDALRYAMAQTDAECGAIAWADDEEPVIEVRAIGLALDCQHLTPEELSPETPFAPQVQLFDSTRNRLLRVGEMHSTASKGPVDDPFARRCGVEEGLALPFTAVTGRGEILLIGIPGICADHVELGSLLAREIGSGFDRQSTLALVRETAVTRMRDAVARDLHDTIAQSLAGVSLRMEGLRQWIKGGGDPDEEIQAIKSALRAEQAQVRGMIDRLRGGETVLPNASATRILGPLLHDLAEYWGIAIELDDEAKWIVIPGSLAHEVRQVLREAVANAVRHGGASRVAIALAEEDSMLHLTVADNGAGFPDDEAIARPRSIGERIDAIGGWLEVESGPAGAALRFALPLRRRG
jgi:signal transduction histidine kinase